MNLQQLNPYIRYAAHSRIRPPMHIHRRIILDYELIYVESGSFLLRYADTDHLCKEGDILLLCPGVSHSFHILHETLEQPHIHFDLCYDALSPQLYICYQDLEHLPKSHRNLIRENVFPGIGPVLRIKARERFLELFYQVVDHKDPNSLDRRAGMLQLLQLILEDTPSEISPELPTGQNLALRIRSYIDSNFREAFTLDTLQALFRYSKFYLEKVFTEKYGESVMHYRNRKRMEAAPDILKDRSVSATAYYLGFSSVYTFSRAFTQTYGASPTKYIRKQ